MVATLTLMQRVFNRILRRICFAIALSVFFSGCGGGGGAGVAENPTTPPPDLRGVWAGTWTGNSATQGLVTGNWEAEIADQFQGDVTNDPEGFSFSLGLNNPTFTNYWADTRITGMASLRGDIDCMDGDLEGLVDAHTLNFSILHQIVGLLSRTVCGTNEWNLTALDLSDRTTSGVWSKRSSTDTGTFTGTRIAQLGGPRIRYFNPPSGREGALVTIAGDNFSSSLSDNVLAFDTDLTPALAATTTTLTSSRALASINLVRLMGGDDCTGCTHEDIDTCKEASRLTDFPRWIDGQWLAWPVGA